QNYFRLYGKLAGMTGTAETEEEEFFKIYEMDVSVIPTNQPVQRKDEEDAVYRTQREKYKAIINEIVRLHELGLPVLVGTTSVEISELIARMLGARTVQGRKLKDHVNVLNAKQHQREAEIVAQAGRPGAITIATNMAGRGTDIKITDPIRDAHGENGIITRRMQDDPGLHDRHITEYRIDPNDQVGGLQIIGTSRHEARRIDRQLRGRSGRQGDPGRSKFYVSLEDDIMRMFGGERIGKIMDSLGINEGEVITHAMVTRIPAPAQAAGAYSWELDEMRGAFLRTLRVDLSIDESEMDTITVDELEPRIIEDARKRFKYRKQELGDELYEKLLRYTILRIVDQQWMDHLYEMDRLKEGIGLRSYAQKDPLIEYKREGLEAFEEMLGRIAEFSLRTILNAQIQQAPAMEGQAVARGREMKSDATGMGLGQTAPPREAQPQRAPELEGAAVGRAMNKPGRGRGQGGESGQMQKVATI
ncbi:MAG: hypothetical protein P8169_15670, partial [Chloroflexota bacterium]